MSIYLYGVQETYKHQDHRESIEATDVCHAQGKGNVIDAGQKHTAQLH